MKTLLLLAVISLNCPGFAGDVLCYEMTKNVVDIAIDVIQAELPADSDKVSVTLYRIGKKVEGKIPVDKGVLEKSAKNGGDNGPFSGRGRWFAVQEDDQWYAIYIQNDGRLFRLCTLEQVFDAVYTRSSLAVTIGVNEHPFWRKLFDLTQKSL